MAGALAGAILTTGPVQAAETMESLAKRLDALAAENHRLQQRVDQLEAQVRTVRKPIAATAQIPAPAQQAVAQRAPAVQPRQAHAVETASAARAVPGDEDGASFIGFDHAYAYDVLDPTTDINQKQEMLLKRKVAGKVGGHTVTVGGAVTAIADIQHSNTTDKFGYLMRHPTSANQRTKDVSEAVLHSAQLEVTASLGSWTMAYLDLLYSPEQSFGAGTITAVTRNQIQLRHGYVMFGNLDETPFYAALGKMATPFGLTDTLNPFTASTVWHAFGGLAYGIKAGFLKDGWNVRAMAIQGGAEFRGANAPVDNSNVPSKLNNFAVDASYRFGVWRGAHMRLGGSYERGSAYCQPFPITHFSSCNDANGAYDVYAQLQSGPWQFQAEFARTVDVWPGTFNPTIPQYKASRVTSWDVGGRYRHMLGSVPMDVSFDFSRFIAGPSGAPWEKQDQWVLGVAGYVAPSAKLFMELVRTEGYTPLNFLTGGNLGPGVTWSDAHANSNIVTFGANVAF